MNSHPTRPADRRRSHEEESLEVQRLVVSERYPLPARRLHSLVQQLLRVSRAQAAQVIQSGGALINGRPTRTPHTLLNIGDRLEVLPLEKPLPPAPQAAEQGTVEIVLEDEHLVVVDKPAGLLTVPTPYRERNTLIHLLEKRTPGPKPNVFCVHRLDRGVSGLLVFARRLEIATALRDQFEQRKPQRRYVALVAGHLKTKEGTFRSHLATDRNLHRYSTDDPAGGELAITHYRVLKALSDTTLVEVWLETGRRNQIRVHFAEAGHPVVGDPRYGGVRARHRRWAFRRLALHAESLAFRHPVTGESLELHAPWPPELVRFQQQDGASERPPARRTKRSPRRPRGDSER